MSEDYGRELPCGCSFSIGYDRIKAYTLCPLHDAAEDLLTACKAVAGIDNPPSGAPGHIDLSDAIRMANQAALKATGNYTE